MGVGDTGAEVLATGAGVGIGNTGAEVVRTGAGVGNTGAGVVRTGAGVGNTGAGVGRTGAGVGTDVDEPNFVETLALAGTVPTLIEFTVIFMLLLVPAKLVIVMVPPALSFACSLEGAYPVPVERVVTRT